MGSYNHSGIQAKLAALYLVPTLCVGMPLQDARRPVFTRDAERLGGIPTQSVGTRK
jgi:hypothetical protein